MIARPLLATAMVLVATSAFAADPVGSAPESKRSDDVQGNWLGVWKGKGGMGGKNVAEICGLGNGEYQATFTAYDSGEQDKGVFTFAINGSSVSDDKVVFTQRINVGLLGGFSFDADVENGQLLGKYSNGNRYQGTMELKRIEKKPEQVGTKPLPGAVVLFDGTSLDHWTTVGKTATEWKLAEGVLVAPTLDAPNIGGTGHLATKAPFGDAQLHVEFRVPYAPDKRGQERGQGGLYLWGQYELQIVDSFGFARPKNSANEFADDDALGAIYKQHAPRELPALPPGEWQAFDITLRAAKRDANKEVTQPAEVTVFLNGTQIHERVELTTPTENAPLADVRSPARLVLANDGQPVEYRSIWYVPLDASTAK
ncbi:MAG TPA: DUF1080 domain-containing protein [Planctomycetaceae bacterium]|nr:DUF1080 domain-containing protein [Planctomycetaceae bacterium]